MACFLPLIINTQITTSIIQCVFFISLHSHYPWLVKAELFYLDLDRIHAGSSNRDLEYVNGVLELRPWYLTT